MNGSLAITRAIAEDGPSRVRGAEATDGPHQAVRSPCPGHRSAVVCDFPASQIRQSPAGVHNLTCAVRQGNTSVGQLTKRGSQQPAWTVRSSA